MISVSDVIREVAQECDTTPELLRGPRRMKGISHPRQVAYLLAAELCPHLSIMAIAREFGDRDHATILYGIRRAQNRLREQPQYKKIVDDVCSRLAAPGDS